MKHKKSHLLKKCLASRRPPSCSIPPYVAGKTQWGGNRPFRFPPHKEILPILCARTANLHNLFGRSPGSRSPYSRVFPPKGSDIMRFRLDYSGAAAPAYTGFPYHRKVQYSIFPKGEAYPSLGGIIRFSGTTVKEKENFFGGGCRA